MISFIKKNKSNKIKYASALERSSAYLIDSFILLFIRSVAITSIYMVFFNKKIVEILNQYRLIFEKGDYTRTSPEVMEFMKSSGAISYSLSLIFISVLIFITIGCFYYTLMNMSSWKTTIGGKLTGFYTVTNKNEKISLHRGFVRYFLSILPWFLACFLTIKIFALFISGQNIEIVTQESHNILVFTGILYVTWYDLVLFNSKKKTVYDLICGTVVIKGKADGGLPKWSRAGNKGIFTLPKKILAEFRKLKKESRDKSKIEDKNIKSINKKANKKAK